MSRTIVVLLLALTPAALSAQAVGSLSPDVRQYKSSFPNAQWR